MYGYTEAQSVSGVVSDENGPLPGVNVVVKGTAIGTTTDFDGNYQLDNVTESAVLVYSYLGYLTKEVTVNGQSTINTVLQENLEALDEVIVVAYGTTTKKDLTGAVATVSGDDLNTIPATSVDQALQGKTAGVQITQNSGAPGSSVSVSIRGVGSFGSSTPLYVVDGFPTQDISFLNPNDIQSISVLKDASASALYGVRASNGVVIIETKGGIKDKITVDVNSWVAISSAPKNIDLLDVDTFAGFATELGNASSMPILDEWSNPSALTNVDWQDYAFSSAVRTGHSVAVRGGGEQARIALTAGYLDEEGVVIGSSNTRYNTGLKANYDISDNLRVNANVKYTFQERYQTLGQGYYNLGKLFTNVPYLSNTTGTNLPYDGNGNYGAFTDSAILGTSSNVLASALEQDNDNGNNTFLGNFGVAYDFLDGFTIKGNYGVVTRSYSSWNFLPSYFRSTNNNETRTNAEFSQTSNTSNEWVAEGLLEYNKEFGKHKVGFLAGWSAQRNSYKNLSARGVGFLNNSLRDLSQADEITEVTGISGTSTLASNFARVNYSFDSKYYLTATVRRDGNGDRFGENNLWGVFPAFALGWNIDEESFMEDSVFDVLKFRASWGETGNYAGIDAYQYSTFYGNGNSGNDAGYVFGGNEAQGLYAENLPNPDLQWETQQQTNFGLEGALLDNKLYFSLDWFNKKSSDFLFNTTIPAQTGFSTKAVNAGEVVNKGFEFLLGYRQFGDDFSWDASVNLTVIDNEITKLTELDYTLFPTSFLPDFVTNWLDITRSYVGGNVGTFYGYRSDGIFQTQSEIDALNTASPNGAYQHSETAPGDRRFKDLSGDGQIDDEDKEVIGSPIPDFYGGLNLSASYKNFDLGLDIYGSYGNDILNFVRVELESAGGYGVDNAFTNISTEYYNNMWTTSNPSTTYARATLGDANQNNRVSDYFVEDGSFLRLRNIKLAYNLPSDVAENLGMSNAKIYVSGQNLITLTGYSGWDPEIGQISDLNGESSVQTRGIDFGTYPVSKSITLGVSLQF